MGGDVGKASLMLPVGEISLPKTWKENRVSFIQCPDTMRGAGAPLYVGEYNVWLEFG